MDVIKLKDVLHILDLVMSDDAIKHKGKAIRKRLKELPPVDITEVVRCKECKKWDTSIKLLNTCVCTRWSQSMPYPRLTSPDDFCSYGVRKEGAENG